MRYFLAFAVVAFLAGCGEETTQTKTAKKVMGGEKPAQKENKQVAVETHAPKEEKNVAKVPITIAPTPLKSPASEVKTKVKLDGKTLYKSCGGCHGADGKNKALNKSDLIAGWDKEKVIQALKEYKSGSRNLYGMGAVMKGQAAKLTQEEMETLGEYISNF